MSENKVMPEVTKESMEQFIQKHPVFCAGLHNFVMQLAVNLDLDGLNHTRELFTVELTEAVRIVQEKARELSEIPVGDPISWQ